MLCVYLVSVYLSRLFITETNLVFHQNRYEIEYVAIFETSAHTLCTVRECFVAIWSQLLEFNQSADISTIAWENTKKKWYFEWWPPTFNVDRLGCDVHTIDTATQYCPLLHIGIHNFGFIVRIGTEVTARIRTRYWNENETNFCCSDVGLCVCFFTHFTEWYERAKLLGNLLIQRSIVLKQPPNEINEAPSTWRTDNMKVEWENE